MSSVNNILTVKIYGAEYSIKGDTDISEMKAAAEYLDTMMREVNSNLKVDSSLKVAILASLNITYELMKERRDKEKLEKILEDKVDRLNQLLDRQV